MKICFPFYLVQFVLLADSSLKINVKGYEASTSTASIILLSLLPLPANLISGFIRKSSSLSPIQYTSLGCWNDTHVRAIPTREGHHKLLQTTSSTSRDYPIERCALVAASFGDSVFALQNGGWCASSSTAQLTYNKYGASTACQANGAGGPWANNVYRIIPAGSKAKAPGVIWHWHNNVEYTISSEKATFFDAKDNCYSYGGTLALLKTNQTRQFLQTVMLPGQDHFWIGLSSDREVENNAYLWQDDTKFQIVQGNYGIGEPRYLSGARQICTATDSQQLWHAVKCQWKRRYICQRPNWKTRVYCNANSISGPHRNTSYSFPKTEAGLTSMSKENCPEGYPFASIKCSHNVTQPGHTYFETPLVIVCGTSIASLTSQMNPYNATTTSVSTTLAFLKILTSITGLLNPDDIAIAAKVLQALSMTDPKKVAIELSTMYDVLITIDQITQALSLALSGSSSASNKKSDIAQRQAIVKAMQAFADRVSLPENSVEIKLVASQTTLQVTEPQVNNGKHASAVFVPSNMDSDAQEQVISVDVPGTLLDQIKPVSRKKRSSVSSTTPLRTSFVLNDNAALFPSREKPAAPVLSINIRDHQLTSTNVGIIINFRSIESKQGSIPFKNGTLKDVVTRTQCSVYQADGGRWVSTGCSLVSGSSPPQCTCFKLASFSMIVSTKVLPSAFALGIVSYVGCSLSILGLLVTIAVYLAVKKLRKRQPAAFLLNICFNLLAVNLIFVFGVGRTSDSTECYMMTALLHYFLIVTWFWMSANAHNMYKALCSMAHIGQTSTTTPSIICYLLPALIVLINSTVAIFYVDPSHQDHFDDPFFESSYRARNMCWLRNQSLHFGFLLPVGLLSLFNFACFISIMRKIACKKSTIQSTLQKRTKRNDFAIAISVCTVMGLTWVFGFLMMFADNVIYQSVMAWLFTIFNSTQGLFIFFMNCVRQDKVRLMWWTPLTALCKRQSPEQHRKSDERSEATLTSHPKQNENISRKSNIVS